MKTGNFDSTMLERPHYIRYRTPDSSPVITAIIPDKSSSRGTNAVKITGRNFWAGVKVLIDGMECVTTRAGEEIIQGISRLLTRTFMRLFLRE